MNVPEKIESFVSRALKTQELEWNKLPGDASNRSYWRVGVNARSYILMVMNEAEVFRSEEAQAQGQEDSSSLKELAFVEIARNWKEQGIRVPDVIDVSENRDLVLLEDLGQELLYDRRLQESAIDYYERAIEQLVLIQASSPLAVIQTRHYDSKLLQWEFEHFIEYALEKRPIEHQIRIESSFVDRLRSLFETLTKKIEEQDVLPCHRDFHSKNICLLPRDEVAVIDFQDALMGPSTYDLASLLRDAYVDLSASEESRLMTFFEQKSGRSIDRMAFEATAIQRNLKAVGRFFYIYTVKKKATHLPYVRPCLAKALMALRRLDQVELADELAEVMKRDLLDELA